MKIKTKKTHQLFTSPLFKIEFENIDRINIGLYDLVKNEQKLNKGVIISNSGGWQSSKILFESDESVIIDFLSLVKKAFIEFSKDEFQLDIQSEEIKIEAWANINLKGHKNLSHDHTAHDNHWSGVYYLKAGDDSIETSGHTIFEDRHYTSNGRFLNRIPVPKKSNTLKPREFEVIPSKNTMVFFPGSLYHRVDLYEGIEERITIAFNVRSRHFKNYDFDKAGLSSKLTKFLWYNFRGPMRVLVFLKNKIFYFGKRK